MRIGELAALVGVSTRTVRHYHQVGVLPEPERAPNGYREYGLDDAVLLVRARRLVDLGLALGEVAGVLADDRGRDLDELLAEVTADLAERERSLQEQRRRIDLLRARLSVGSGTLANSLEEAGITEFFDAVRPAGAGGAAADHDRRLLSLLDGDDAVEVAGALASVGADDGAAARLAALYERFGALAGSAMPDADEVTALATGVVEALPQALAGRAREQMNGGGMADLALITDDLSPGQRLVVDAIVALLGSSGDPA